VPSSQGAHAFLVALTVVLGVAAVTTVLFQRLRQPVVLGYLLVADVEIVQTLSELGVILLMFALGLEFSLKRLARVGPTAEDVLARMRELLPGLGEPVAVRLAADSPAVGRSLAALRLRGLTGADRWIAGGGVRAGQNQLSVITAQRPYSG
jgi:hypothetical protein